MTKNHRQSITVTPDLYAAVEAYQQQHAIKTWSQALVHLAAAALKWDQPMPAWGGDHKSHAYRAFIKRMDAMSPTEAQAFLESIEG